MCIGIVFVTIVSFYLLKFLYRNEKLDNPDPPELAEIKREIHIWQRTRNSIHPAVRPVTRGRRIADTGPRGARLTSILLLTHELDIPRGEDCNHQP